MSKRFTHNGIVIVDHLKKDLIYIDGDENLLDLAEYVDRVQYENEQLKQQLFETSKELLWATSDEVDRALHYEDEVEELRKEIFE